MAANNGILTPAQRRSIQEVQDACRRAAPHLTALRMIGLPMEQEEARMQHLLNCCEGLENFDKQIQESEGK